MEKRELIKVLCRAVVLVKDGDKVLREETTTDISCYSLEEMGTFYAKAIEDVETMNEANKPNRARRRKAE